MRTKAEPASSLSVRYLHYNITFNDFLAVLQEMLKGWAFFPRCPCEQHISVMYIGSLGNSYRVECEAIGWSWICSIAELITQAVGSFPHGRHVWV